MQLKPGQFVAVCRHLYGEGNPVPIESVNHWDVGGKARNLDKPAQTTTFEATALCAQCAKSDRSTIEFHRARVFGNSLNFGWWEFQPTRNPGRPNKTQVTG